MRSQCLLSSCREGPGVTLRPRSPQVARWPAIIYAVTSSVTDDPVVGGSLWRDSTASDFMFPLALSFGKCQNQVPEALLVWHIPIAGFIPVGSPCSPLRLL